MPGSNYTTFKHGTEPVGGHLQITPQMGELRPHWATYFTVNDAEETARKAVKLGAKLCMTMKNVPGVCRFCGITSRRVSRPRRPIYSLRLALGATDGNWTPASTSCEASVDSRRIAFRASLEVTDHPELFKSPSKLLPWLIKWDVRMNSIPSNESCLQRLSAI